MNYLLKNPDKSFWIAWAIAVVMIVAFRANKEIKENKKENTTELICY